MKIRLIIAAAFCTAMASLALGAITPPPAWSVEIATNAPGITNTVYQITADGAGGCVVTHSRFAGGATNWYLTRFDKKGAQVQSIGYIGCYALEVLHCDKKVVVFTASLSPYTKFIGSWDTKHKSTGPNDILSDFFPDQFTYAKGGGLADSKGFFAVAYTSSTKIWTIMRYLYKDAE